MPTYTFTDAEAPQTIEPGVYDFTIDETEEAVSKSGGNQMLVIHCREVETGAKIRDQLVFTQAAAWKIDTCLKACGIYPRKGEQVDVSDKLLKGRTFRAEVIHESGQSDPSKKFAKIARYIAGEPQQQQAKPAVQW